MLKKNLAWVALAGGVSLNLAPRTMVKLTKFGGLAPDGISKAFDAHADGFGRGEGGGVLILKRLNQALRLRKETRRKKPAHTLCL